MTWPAAPLSPDETKTLCPCAAACLKSGSSVFSMSDALGEQNA